MNRKSILVGLVLASFAISGCAPSTVGQDPGPEITKPASSAAASQAQPAMPSYQALLQKNGVRPAEIRSFIDGNLQGAAPAEAAAMILGLEEVQQRELPALEQAFSAEAVQKQLQAVRRPGSGLSGAGADLQALLRQAQDDGYKIETAEGMYFPVIDYTLYQSYQPFVTADIAAYIGIMSAEAEQPPAKDAALVIGWDELLRRAAAQEAFLGRYGHSVRQDAVQQLYSRYVTFAFYGANNTPLFGYEDQTLDAEAKRDYQAASASGGNSRLLTAIGDFLAVAAKNGGRLTAEVDEFRKAATADLLASPASSR